jgi:hypothetical protein
MALEGIQAPTTEAALPMAVRSLPQITLVVPVQELPLFPDAVSPEPAQSEPRRSAFKKEAGTPREWKPVD